LRVEETVTRVYHRPLQLLVRRGENITAIQDVIDATYTRNVGYDDRLTAANTGTSLWGTGSYTYDAWGT